MGARGGRVDGRTAELVQDRQNIREAVAAICEDAQGSREAFAQRRAS
jgi:phage baseplate assembly protein W